MPNYDYQCQNERCLYREMSKPKEFTLPVNHKPPLCDGCGLPMGMVFTRPPSMSMGKWLFHNPKPDSGSL